MELLFVALGGALLGIAARYLLPKRETHGALLVPALGVIAASVVWAALTWAGLKFDGGWIWVLSLVASGVISVLTSVVLGRQRSRRDAQLLSQLSRA